jgi:hypothetical protein
MDVQDIVDSPMLAIEGRLANIKLQSENQQNYHSNHSSRDYNDQFNPVNTSSRDYPNNPTDLTHNHCVSHLARSRKRFSGNSNDSSSDSDERLHSKQPSSDFYASLNDLQDDLVSRPYRNRRLLDGTSQASSSSNNGEDIEVKPVQRVSANNFDHNNDVNEVELEQKLGMDFALKRREQRKNLNFDEVETNPYAPRMKSRSLALTAGNSNNNSPAFDPFNNLSSKSANNNKVVDFLPRFKLSERGFSDSTDNSPASRNISLANSNGPSTNNTPILNSSSTGSFQQNNSEPMSSPLSICSSTQNNPASDCDSPLLFPYASSISNTPGNNNNHLLATGKAIVNRQRNINITPLANSPVINDYSNYSSRLNRANNALIHNSCTNNNMSASSRQSSQLNRFNQSPSEMNF